MKIFIKDRKNLIWAISILVLVLLANRHYADVKAGAIESGDYWLFIGYGILTVCVLVFAIVCAWIFFHKGGRKIESVFVVCSLVLGILYLCVLPPLSAPDEVSHYITAYQLSNQMLGKPVMNENGRIYIRQEDAFIEDVYGAALEDKENPEKRVTLGKLLTEHTYQEIYDRGLFGVSQEGVTISDIYNVQTTPLAYVPQAIGISLARILHMSGIGLLFMGRLFNLLFYVQIVYLAMKRLPFGKEVLFGVAMLPMTLNLTGSMSYDVIILALSYYFTACCLWLAYEADRVRKRDVAVLALVAGVLMPCKMVYIVLLGLCFLIPVRKFGGWKPYLISAAVVLASVAVAMLLINSQVIRSYAAEAESYVPWAEEAGYSLPQLLHSPRLVVEMFYNTLVWQSDYYYLTMMGTYLGNLDEILNVPFLVIAGQTIILAFLSLQKPGEVIYITKRQKIWIGFLCLSCLGLTMFSMLVAWTPLSAKMINGVQGRYFLPLLPVLLMAAKNSFVVMTKNIDRILLYLMCCANGYVLLRLFATVSMRL